jgi:hypothetical protein
MKRFPGYVFPVTLVSVFLGCGGQHGPARDLAMLIGEDCLLVPELPQHAERITIALTEDLNPYSHAPSPANEAERVVFRHLYETLVRVDCKGEVQPGLAVSWETSDGGRIWSFTLRDNVRFSDGSHMVGEDIHEAWEGTVAEQLRRGVSRNPPWTWVHPDSVRTMGDDKVLIALTGSLGDKPLIFALPELAVVKRLGLRGSSWPLGSGSYLLSLDNRLEQEVALIPNPYHPGTGRGLAPLRFQIRSGADPRDMFGGDADVVFVEDRATVDYAVNLPGFIAHELAWNRVYFLLSPHLSTVSLTPEATASIDRLKEELAREVMSAESRAASVPDCSSFGVGKSDAEKPFPRLMTEPVSDDDQARRVLYLDGDSESERLAARLVALAAADDPRNPDPPLPIPWDGAADTEPVASGLPWWPFVTAVNGGREWAYVLSHRQSLPDPCLDYGSPFS